MLQLIQLFQDAGYQIHLATTAEAGPHASDLHHLGVETYQIQLNDSGFDSLIAELQPEAVLFDRFMTEEQFGWRVSEACPKAMKILDTEDLHFLRQARHQAIKDGIDLSAVELYTDLAKRELASMWRSDLSLIISEVEYQLLSSTFGFPEALMHYLPFLVRPSSLEPTVGFHDRQDFICVGNFKHAPNLDAVAQLKELWPAIRKAVPSANLRIYGAYAPPHVEAWNNPTNGFHIAGWVADLPATMRCARVQLAPIRFGAGLKGKILDAMLQGTPSVTTTVGAEGMCGTFPFPGVVASDFDQFVKEAICLYTDESSWNRASEAAKPVLVNRFDQALFAQGILDKVRTLQQSLGAHRKAHFMGQILQHNQLNALKFMSKWIEEKNKNP